MPTSYSLLPQLPTLPSLGRGALSLEEALRPRRKKPPELSEEEQTSLLNKLMSGLEYTAYALDKPGAAVRGTLSGLTGGPWGGGLLNLVPFSGTMGLTDPKKRVWGQDILHRWGLTAKNRPGLHITDPEDLFGDVAGLGLEIITDPLFWMTGPLGSVVPGSPLAKAQRPAKLALENLPALKTRFAETVLSTAKNVPSTVTTPVTFAEQIRAGQRGLLGIKAPWMREPIKVFGAGSEKAAKAAEMLAYGKFSPARGLRGLFSPRAGMRAGIIDELLGDVQKLRDVSYVERQKIIDAGYDLVAGVAKRQRQLFGEWDAIANALGKNGDKGAFADFARLITEAKGGVPSTDDILVKLKQALQIGADQPLPSVIQSTDDLARSWHEYADALRTVYDTMGMDYVSLGGNMKMLDDEFIEYLARHASPAIRKFAKSKRAGEVHKFWQARRALLRDFPGGTAEINAISRNRLITATADKLDEVLPEIRQALGNMGVPVADDLAAEEVQQLFLYHKHIKPGLDEALATGTIDQARHAKLVENWGAGATGKQAAKYFRKLPEEVLQQGMFGDDLASELLLYTRAMAGKQADLRIAHHYLRQPSVLVDQGAANAVKLADVWKRAGFTDLGLDTWVRRNFDVLGYQSFDEMISANAGLIADIATDNPEQMILDGIIGNLAISEDGARALKAYAAVQKPQNIHGLGRLLDKITSTYRGALTLSFPSFHSRNALSGYWQSLTDGQVSPAELLAAYKDAYIHAASKGAKPQLKFIEEFLDAGGMSGHGQMQMITGGKALTAARIPEGPLGGATKAFVTEGTWKPWKWRGGFMAEGEKLFAPAAAGERLYELVEFMNRGAYYEALRRKGFGPAQAMQWVKRSQFDYSEMSRFSRDVMRRVTPFWGWIHRNIPYQLQKLMERPGGGAAQTFRLMTQPLHGQDTYVPSFLREMMGIRAGGEEQAAHFIRQAGIPIEDLNRFVMGPGFGLPRGVPQLRTFAKMAAQLTPPITAPTEYFAGKQLWTGRKFEEMVSPTERLTEAVAGKGQGIRADVVDRLLSTSPGARFVSETMGVIDPRKSWWQKLMNATTGVKFSTYDVERWRYIDLINELRRQAGKMPYVREGEYYYVPERYRGRAQGQEAQELIRVLAGLEKEAKKVRQKRERQEARRK